MRNFETDTPKYVKTKHPYIWDIPMNNSHMTTSMRGDIIYKA